MSQTYQTQNTALALALHTAGVPWATAADGAPLPPILNIYDAQILRDRGLVGFTLEEAAKRAVERGIPGRIFYQFQRTQQCERIIKGYEAQRKLIEGAADGETATATLITPEEFGALAAQILHNRKALVQSWTTAPAFISISGSSKVTTEGAATYVVGSFQVIPLNSTAATRAKLGVK